MRDDEISKVVKKAVLQSKALTDSRTMIMVGMSAALFVLVRKEIGVQYAAEYLQGL